MKKASKAIAFAMASAMAVSMAACGGSASSSASGATTEDSASATGNGSYDQVTYVYRGLMELNNVGMSAAAGLYQSIVGFVLVLIANQIVRKLDADNALF